MKFILVSGLVLLATVAIAQDLPPVSAATDYARLHIGLNPPKLLHSVDPEYTPQARQAEIEGSMVLQVVISMEGRVAYASVLSPLPCGLDAQALAAVKQWRFAPGMMDGEIVPVLTTVDVVFRLPYRASEPAAEQRRRDFQRIVDRVSKGGSPKPDEIEKIKYMALHDVTPAIGLLGEWMVKGAGMPKDVPGGMVDIQQAAAKNDAGSLFFVGTAELTGAMVPKNEAHGWVFIQRAAFLGSAEAQRVLGDKNERDGKLNEAKRYFRMCAATADAGCEYRLGKLLVTGPGVNPNDFSQGVAWLESSKEHGNAAAGKLYQESVAKLSSIQLEWVAGLKPHVELRNFRGF